MSKNKRLSIRKNPYFITYCLVLLTLSGCQTTQLPESISQKAHRLKEINSKLYDNLQILLAFSQQEDCDLNLANKAIDGVFVIIGRPDSQEMLVAKCLEEKDVNNLINNSVDLKKEKARLVKEIESEQKQLTTSFYKFKESHAIVGFIKYVGAILGLIVLVGGVFFLKSRII